MKVGIPKETRPGENRVAATPETVKKLKQQGLKPQIESGAGLNSAVTDEQFTEAGAEIVDRDAALSADIVMKVRCPLADEVGKMRKGALLVSLLDPFGDGAEMIPALAKQGVNAVCMEKLPRSTRAQSMDVLSSQAGIAGYKAVIEAAHHFGRMFPMMMTAAGSVPPAKLFVLGAGVAGLQAIATGRRLGAQVEAFDVRPAVKEEILSLGAKFLDLKLEESGAGEGGYAKELSREAQQQQRDALAREAARADMIITTAQIPGKPAPLLLTEEAVKNMKVGSVIVDMAAGSGGNCPLSKPDKIVVEHGVTIIGYTNYPSMMADHSSRFYARNLFNLLVLMLDAKDEGGTRIKYDLEDDIVAASLVAYNGENRMSAAKT